MRYFPGLITLSMVMVASTVVFVLALTGHRVFTFLPDADRNACLFDAVRAYPSWDTGNGPLLDHVESCTGQDKTLIRQLMDDFVTTANTNAERRK